MKPLFTPEELAELAAYDAEIDDEPLSAQDYRESAQRDKDAVFAEKGVDERRKRRRIAAYQREYYEANKDQIAAYQREYIRKNREKWNAYMREYQRRRRAAARIGGGE